MKNRGKLFFIFAAVCIVLAALFKFALIGYGFAALFFLLLAAAFFGYGLAACLKVTRPGAAKALNAALTALICLCLTALILIEIPIVQASAGDEDPEADYLIVLGAGVNGTVPSLSLRNRLDAALEYLRAYPEAVCVVSGGKGPGEAITEAACMQAWLVERGIENGRIVMEDRAENTEENIAFSMAMIPDDARVAVISSEYHLYRTKVLAERQGYALLAVPAKTTYPVLRLNYFFREAFAMVELWLFG